ncbi:voltage-gated chloride channel family protein [Agarivorans sp. MS3-6]|uniref:voltage-gated chloride channel family protein n=1 Tax=Agarivorans sp. TSD2052 TaxID=2937286 RepID=UPI00200CFCBF|nr:voltage-gated chloride channel family protein [Agarivorans sp. TSD2052]UPW20578.1 voltage-gated chloride channel family protein [Agarivorans sp. TSD2052]
MANPLPNSPRTLLVLLRWLLLLIPMAIAVGTLNAMFLWLLDYASHTRAAKPYLLYFLPFAGIAVVFVYRRFGKNAELGNNLIIDEIHQPGAGIPLRMAPLVLFSTVVTHLFGGSAGREGTAVQIGGACSAAYGKWFKLNGRDYQILLSAGVAAGFSALFSTPLAATIFALEVLALGRIRFDSVIPALFAAILADVVCTAWGAPHTQYKIDFLEHVMLFEHVMHVDLWLLGKVLLASIAFGLTGFLFGEAVFMFKDIFKHLFKNPYLIVVIGALIVIGLVHLIGHQDYIGLGVNSSREGGVSIISAFNEGGAEWYSWMLKLLLTAITLAAGFKGGEVTPLFFIGATLGNTLAWVMGAPVDLFAALGFIAVFAAATNTPLACTIMGVELFGSDHLLYFAVACFVAYYFSGHTGIYSSQRIAVPKSVNFAAHEKTLGEVRATRNKIARWFRSQVK